jgi:hypothetical protein
LFDEWNAQRKGEPIEQVKIARYGTSIGCSGNIRRKRPTLKRCHGAHAPTTNGSCR